MNKKIIKITLISIIGFMAIVTIFLAGCKESATKMPAELTREEIKSYSFDKLFQAIEAKEIPEDVFTLIGENFGVLTSGNSSHYNSMIIG